MTTDATTLVLLHGLCCRASDWQWHIDAFARHHRVFAPTLRGHAGDVVASGTMTIERLAADVVEHLVTENITDAIVCGHSLGTRVALEVHAQVPDRVKGLVLIDGSNTVDHNLNTVLAGFDAATDNDKLKPWAKGLFDQMFLPNTFPAEQSMYRKRIDAMPAEQLRAVYQHLITWDGTRFDERLKQAALKPVLVLQSTIRPADATRRSLKPGETGDFVDRIQHEHPNTTVITYPHCGHFINLDDPEALRKDISVWMNTHRLA